MHSLAASRPPCRPVFHLSIHKRWRGLREGTIPEAALRRWTSDRDDYSSRSMYQELSARRMTVPERPRKSVASVAVAGHAFETKARSRSNAFDQDVDNSFPIGSNQRSHGEQANAMQAMTVMKRMGRRARCTAC